MPIDKGSSSDDSSESFTFDLHDMPEITAGSKLKDDWEALESTLYEENSDSILCLKSNMANECKLWKESFPYLRVRGLKIENPLHQTKLKLKQHVITTVVDRLIEKIAGEGLNLGHGRKVQRPAAPNKESYFERGKRKREIVDTLKTATETTTHVLQSVKDPAPARLQTMPKPLPRGILKNSPNRTPKKQERKIRKKPTSQDTLCRNSSLPKISTKSNNWLTRSERRCNDSLPSSHFNHSNHCIKIRQPVTKDTLTLPPITPGIDIT